MVPIRAHPAHLGTHILPPMPTVKVVSGLTIPTLDYKSLNEDRPATNWP